ncbi:MAG: GT-D fold domain-containing glycosyltransferase [Bacillota bacterium]
MSELLDVNHVLNYLHKALEKRIPFSLVRVGDGENIILSQFDILGEEYVNSYHLIKIWWKKQGLSYPAPDIKEDLLEAIGRANMVGILPYNDQRINAPQQLKRPLTDKIFELNNIKPSLLCDAYVTRYMPDTPYFWQIIAGKKVLLVSKWADVFKEVIGNQYKEYGIKVTGAISITNYHMKDTVFNQILKSDFDIALISAGVAAVVLAQKTAEQCQRVAVDFGRSSQIISQRFAGGQ